MQATTPLHFLCSSETTARTVVIAEIKAARVCFLRLNNALHIKVVTLTEDHSCMNSYVPLKDHGFGFSSEEPWKSTSDKANGITILTRLPYVFECTEMDGKFQIATRLHNNNTDLKIERYILEEHFFKLPSPLLPRMDICPALHTETKKLHLLVLAPTKEATFSLMSYVAK